MPEWILADEAASQTVDTIAPAVAQQLEEVQEALADAQAILARDDIGWARLGDQIEETADQRKSRIRLARLMASANPMIKRGLGLRIGYVWGQGVEVAVRQTDDEGRQDVNGVVQAFLDDTSNTSTFSGSQAREALEMRLGTDGEVALCLDTDPSTGRVQVRVISCDQITDRITDPEDEATVWFYRRDYQVAELKVDGTKGAAQTRTVWYPALGYRPEVGKQQPLIGGKPVRWHQPVLFVAVNQIGDDWRGRGDAHAALPWAKASKEFLESWALLMKALSRFAWRATSRGDKTQRVAATMQRAQQTDTVGAAAGLTTGDTLEAIPKSGATIDANSGRPLQMLVAAALGVPVTMLLGDPGATGARAVAETLDQPTELEMGRRRRLWSEVLRSVIDHVIDSAVIGFRGPLRGIVAQQGDRRLVTLPDGDSRTVEVSWPSWESTPVDVLMKAISLADSMDKLPPLVTVRLTLQALGVEDIDEVLEAVTDDEGHFLPPEQAVAAARARADERGAGL